MTNLETYRSFVNAANDRARFDAYLIALLSLQVSADVFQEACESAAAEVNR